MSAPPVARARAAAWAVLAALLALAARAPQEATAPADGALTVTFLGNEGFLLEAGAERVLVDALVGDQLPTYVHQEAALREALERAESPYDEVGLVLATHVHADHFSAAAVARHLTSNPRARFVSTPQAVAKLREESGFAALEQRVTAVGPEDGGRARVEGLALEVLAMHHGRDRRPAIENDAFLFELGGWRILHMGDSECTPDELAAFDLAEAEVDVAFVPSWYLDASPWKGAIPAAVAPRWTVAMHLAPDWSHEDATAHQRESRARVERILTASPQAVVFEEALEVRRFERPVGEDG